MDEYFEKNLAFLGRLFPHFVEEIRNAAPKHPVDSDLTNLENDAQNWFTQISYEAAQTIFVYGLGSGAYYFPCRQWLAQDPERYLVFLEEDLSVVHRFLSTPQAEEIMAHPQVIVQPFYPYSEEKGELRENEFSIILAMFSDTKCLFSESHRQPRGRRYSKLKRSLQLMMRYFLYRLQFYDLKFLSTQSENMYRNLFELEGAKSLYGLTEKFKDTPAIICGAGPSLTADMPLLAKLKERALIFGAGTGMNVLNNFGVEAHIGLGTDPHPATLSRIITNTAYETPYFFTMKFYHHALKLLHGPRLFFRGATFGGLDCFDDKLQLENQKKIHTKPSTTHACLGAALEMGCNPIILLGLDLTYTDKKRYPEMKAHPLDTRGDKLNLVNLPQQDLIQIKDKDGKDAFTRADWMYEANTTMRLAEANPNTTFINATSRGFFIPKLTTESLEKVHEKHLSQSDDLENRLHAEIQLCPTIQASQSSVREWLLELKISLEKCLLLLKLLEEELSTKPSPFPTMNYEELSKYFQDEIAYQSLLKELDSSTTQWFFRSIFRHTYHPETLSSEEILDAKLQFESRRISFLIFTVERQLNALECALNEDHLAVEQKCAPKVIRNGQIRAELPKKNGLLHGQTAFFAPDGTLLARGQFVEGIREGENLQNYLSGKLYSIQRFHENNKQGRQEYYYESGIPKTELNYEKGKLEGAVKLYHPNGNLKRELHFKEGVRHGNERMWDARGQILMELEYDHGTPVGTARSWFSNGQRQKEVVYYDSEDHCDYIEWDEKGNLIQKDLYYPEAISPNLLKDSGLVSDKISQLKDKLKKMQEK